MQRRNWLELSRKLVDRYDMDDTDSYIAAAINKNVTAVRRYGISPNKDYPSPFQTTLSGAAMTGTVTAGVAFDPSGQRVEMSTTQGFTLPAANATNPYKAYLVLRYATLGQTFIPKPADPALNVDLDLVDSFSLVVLAGTPAGSPAYPALLANDIVLMGFTVHALDTFASQATEDATVRDQGLDSSIKSADYTVTPNDKFLGMNATGGNRIFTLTKFKFAEGSEWTLQKTDASANTVTINTGAVADVFRLDGSTPTSLVLESQGESVSLKVVGGVCYIL